MKKNRWIALGLSALMILGLAACGSTSSGSAAGGSETGSTEESTAAAAETADSEGAAGAQKYTIGICQLVQHPALNAATKGFRDAIDEALPGQVSFDEQNAAGDSATCITIAGTLVSEKVDLILANATPALQAVTSATAEIPILGTSVTEYGTALSIENFDGTVGGNVSGTSDLAPLDQQAAIFDELLPDAENIGILYCSAEANSVYQASVVEKALTEKGKKVTVYTFADSNDVATVTQNACNDNDALYIPTDNTAASCTEAIDNVARSSKTPIVCGEESIMAGCGIATLSIDYYELGKTTGQMAVRILTGEQQISEMPVEYYQNPVKKYDADRCAEYGIEVPEDYTAYEAE